MGLSGKLAEDTNVFNGVVVKYNEPSEAKKPKRRWRLYVFKGEDVLPFIPLHRSVMLAEYESSVHLRFGSLRSVTPVSVVHA